MRNLILDYPSLRVNFENLSVRPKGIYGVVNPDYEQVWNIPNFENKFVTLKNLDRNSRNEILGGKKQGMGYNAPSGQSLPATARFLDDRFVEFKKDIQEWVHYEVNGGKTNEYQAKKDFSHCFRGNAWMTNFAGTDKRADYINNNSLPPYVQVQPMATGASLLKIVEEVVHKQQKAYLIEAINPTVSGYRKYLPTNRRDLFFRPINSARVKIVDKKGYLIRYDCYYQEPSSSWYGEKMDVPIFGFIENKNSSTGWCNLIEKTRVRILKDGEPVPNPYIMRDGRQLPNPYAGF